VELFPQAFAKFCGGYSALEGGNTTWAIRAMTGDPARGGSGAQLCHVGVET